MRGSGDGAAGGVDEGAGNWAVCAVCAVSMCGQAVRRGRGGEAGVGVDRASASVHWDSSA